MVCFACTLSTGHEGVRAKTGWLEIGIMCTILTTCLYVDCCSGSYDYENLIQLAGRVQSRCHHLIKSIKKNTHLGLNNYQGGTVISH
jgi:hypothetical protein